MHIVHHMSKPRLALQQTLIFHRWLREGTARGLPWKVTWFWLIKHFKPLPYSAQFSSVQSTQSCQTLCNPIYCSTPGLPDHQQLLELLNLMSIELVMPSNHLILCCPLLLSPSIFPSIRVFSNESALCITWPKYWNFCFNISPSNEYSGLISFRKNWLDLLAVQGTLKSLLQHHSSKTSILLCSAFFIVQLYTWLLDKT